MHMLSSFHTQRRVSWWRRFPQYSLYTLFVQHKCHFKLDCTIKLAQYKHRFLVLYLCLFQYNFSQTFCVLFLKNILHLTESECCCWLDLSNVWPYVQEKPVTLPTT